jgi:hypothetical protein
MKHEENFEAEAGEIMQKEIDLVVHIRLLRSSVRMQWRGERELLKAMKMEGGLDDRLLDYTKVEIFPSIRKDGFEDAMGTVAQAELLETLAGMLGRTHIRVAELVHLRTLDGSHSSELAEECIESVVRGEVASHFLTSDTAAADPHGDTFAMGAILLRLFEVGIEKLNAITSHVLRLLDRDVETDQT